MKIGFVGGGKMAEAILAAIVKAGVTHREGILVADLSGERRELLKQRYGVEVTDDGCAVVRFADVVVLAVKPQDQDVVLETLAKVADEKHLFISIAAGRKLARIEALLPKSRVVRVMPNLAALVHESVNVFCCGERATAADRETSERLFSSFGMACELPEALFDAVTALSGSGPAFYAYYVKIMAEAASALGIPEEAAHRLATRTMLGTARLLTAECFDADSLIQAVSSPNGTTVAGMGVLASGATAAAVRGTLSAAANRSAELSR